MRSGPTGLHSRGGNDAGRLIAITVMLVGFGSILTGAVAERLEERDLEAEAEEGEATEEELLRELRDLPARLQRVEAAEVQRRT